MKALYFLLLAICMATTGHTQLLKKIGQKVKRDASWRVESRANRAIDNGVDSILKAPQKILKKKGAKEDAKPAASGNNPSTSNPPTSNSPTTNTKPASNGNPATSRSADDNDMTPKDGFLIIEVSSPTVFTGGSIAITGKSIRYKKYVDVEVTVSGPSVRDVKTVAMDADGKFKSGWFAPDKAGDYTITVKSSDRKASETRKVKVYAMLMLSSWCDENIDLAKKALDKVKSSAEDVKSGLSPKDKAELEKKVDDLKEKVDKVLKLYKDLNTAGKEIGDLAKSGKRLPPNLPDNLSQLNDKLAEERKKLQQLEEYDEHKAADNSVCEYLVMLNEACAAFSVYSNIESMALVTIIGNIQLDKVVPKAVGMVNEKQGWFSEPNDIILKEPAKIFATSMVDAKSLSSAMGVAGFAGDMVQFATDFLMKRYCGLYKGTLEHDYTIEFRNGKGENWWTYGVGTKAVVTLRYPKDKAGGGIIKMKGTIEGNGTHFSFFEDVEKEDGFKDGTKGKIEVVPIKVFTPLAVSFSTAERDILGFGAIARGMATPAYFNIPIDAEYDVDAKKIKIFLNPAIIDFTIYVSNKFVFALVGADLLPYLKQMNFPIHQVGTTLGSVVRSNNSFDVVEDAKGNLSFAGKANKHIGDKASTIETDLNFTITMKKE